MTAARRAVVLLVVAAATAAAAGPDLVPDAATLARDVAPALLPVQDDACVLQPSDRCVGGPGTRRLVRFSVLALNRGDADLVVGRPDPADRLPDGSPTWIYSECHQHWHYAAFAAYTLRRADGSVAATGRKRSFCIQDTAQDPAGPGGGGPRYCCRDTDRCAEPATQGIQAGWGDLYDATLDCQWIDVTDVAPGDYALCVTLDPDGTLAESDTTNDTACVPVTLAGPTRAAPAPVVRMRTPRGRRTRRAGRRVAITWQTRLRHAARTLYGHDVFVSLDDGTTWTLLAAGLAPRVRRLAWDVPAGTSTRAARVRVVAWSDGGQRGEAIGPAFRIGP